MLSHVVEMDAQKSHSPLLTVVTLTKSDPDGFARTAASIAGQTALGDVEWVVVSADGREEMMERLSQYPKLTPVLVSDSAPGIYNAMNAGLEVANGEFVQFLNGGDVLSDSNSLETILPQLRCHPGCLVLARTRRRLGRAGSVEWPSGELSPVMHLFGLRMHAHPSVFAPRRALLGLNGFSNDYGFAGDFHLMSRAIFSLPQVFVPLTVCDYEGGGISERLGHRTHELLGRARTDILFPSGRVPAWFRIIDWSLKSYGKFRYSLASMIGRG